MSLKKKSYKDNFNLYHSLRHTIAKHQYAATLLNLLTLRPRLNSIEPGP